MKTGVIIVAAGRGERAGSPEEGPKQYRLIGGKPVIEHTLGVFLSWQQAPLITIVVHPEDKDLIAPIVERLGAGQQIRCVLGGSTRQKSVLAGLQAFSDDELTHVMIHDAVRPFIDHTLLERTSNALSQGALCALPALAVTDTLKRGTADGHIAETVPRAGLYAAQTPQAFAYRAIRDAHEKAALSGRDDFTDDASIAEWAGLPVKLVEGLVDNVKLTLKRDITMADEKLTQSMPDVRTGNGYDVHQLEPGEGVTLCGVFIPHDQKLKGHSDADVALHALTDALLATCGAGDIGDHFPPSDPQWKGAASRIFLEHAAKVVRGNGGTIMNADVSLIAEEPKIGPHRQAMREMLSEILEITLDRCSVKATTNEKIGFVGRKEGIAAIATATVVYQGRQL
ncbi:bifunctional 2-C-methyl-D-erythritol 4-phosphate cytidylyltransferase/2-C-methyl-D-erythritol 2,4-cyclodiphosphate synthase [Agrobacterium sp.]|jgi:2-C-methyl-D-erythritol 4-phosphate cytidylyltransferase/2-C-methyl-D-erythritol 2,4-cyclodiphosphate synthase|uniref:bifunctional 2-C-methyl-D-erythritol 4-phosphate cytidylyltransferase/2-C-methyl-D-erythritol 2,4-cyclodiphosphate synthase n=1 Tax=Agrobacterium sp. TaxID=361 RepID=UPI0028A5A08A|nr:bifunctional 2-C-methyl-D-erythritol 4-phosphate cytidylyltransferase/2-C-methyl-D-erythritol 2,4-cyclodiphosphate synthase [Agrobacterium sp.]